MRYKTILCVIFVIIILCFTTASMVGQSHSPGNLQEAVTMANDELYYIGYKYFEDSNVAGKPIRLVQIMGLSSVSIGSTNTYGALAYGDSHEEIKNGQSRYIGYTYYNEDYTNPAFPHDAWSGGYLEDRDWIPEPWNNVPGAVVNDFDGDSRYLPNIQKGLSFYYTDISRGGDSHYWNNWHKYVHILAPPTKYTWGMGRMWHNTSGSTWYISVPLTPGIMTVDPDLSTNLETNSFNNVKPGDKMNSTLAYKLNPDHPRPERAWLRLHHVVDGREYSIQLQPVNGAPVPDEKGYITLQPGDVKVYGYTFTVQDRPTKILSRINPVDTKEDRKWDDNRAEATVLPQSYDIKVKIKPGSKTYTTLNGEPMLMDFNIEVTRKDYIPGSIDAVGSYTTKTKSDTFRVNLDPGETVEFTADFSARPGTYNIETEAWPTGASDIYPPDNRDKVTVSVVSREYNPETGIHSETLR